MDSLRDDLSYSLPLLVGFDLVEVDHGGRLPAMGGVGPLVVVEGDPATDASLGLRAGLPSVQIDAFILQGTPEAFDEDFVDAAPFSAKIGCAPQTLNDWVKKAEVDSGRRAVIPTEMAEKSEPLSAIGPRTMASALEHENRELR